MAIRANDRRRLARLAAPRILAQRDAVERRAGLREQRDFFEGVAMLLAIEGIDPQTTSVAIRLRDAEAKLAAIPDTPELEKADEEYLASADTRWIDEEQEKGRRYRPPAREEESFESEIERLMGRYRTDRRETDLTKASPLELYAWCLSRHGATYDEAAADVARTAQDLLLVLEALPEDATEDDIERALSALEDQ